MRKTVPLFPALLIAAGCFALVSTTTHAQVVESAKSRFIFKTANGKADSAEIVTRYQPTKISHPFAKADAGIDPKLRKAATIAEDRAHAHSREQCWHYVKEALVASGIISSYPKSVYAKEAGRELVNNYGFKKLAVRDPLKAPVGSVLVYNNARGAGHVEIRTSHGFASDFRSKTPSPRPLIGVYAKS